MRMIREPRARYSPVPSEPCSEQDRAREQFHLPVVAAQHAEAERSAPTASRAPLPGNRRPLPGGFETHSSFTLSIRAVRNCQPRRKLVAARNLGEASPRCAAKSRANSSGSSAKPRSARFLNGGGGAKKKKKPPRGVGRPPRPAGGPRGLPNPSLSYSSAKAPPPRGPQ